MKNIVVIYGGNTTEKDISIITAIQVITNIDKNLYNVIPVYITENGFFTMKNPIKVEYYINFDSYKWHKVYFNGSYLINDSLIKKKIKIDCSLICCHGGIYEGGGLQGYLEMNNIPYTSTNIFTSSLCMDKAKSKVYFDDIGLNVVDYLLIKKQNYLKEKDEYIDLIINKLGYQLIVKPNDQGSSIGINVCNNKEELISSLILAFSFSDNVIVEKALTNFEEFNCAGLKSNIGLFISDIEKPVIYKDFLTFDNKYKNNNKKVEFPAKINSELEKEIKNTTKILFEYLDLKGVCRCDYLYDKTSQKLYINEINTVPGSLSYYLFKNKLKFSEIINILIESAIIDCKNKNKSTFKTDILSSINLLGKSPLIK